VRAVSALRAANPYAESIDHVNVTCTGATVRARYGADGTYFTGGLLTAQGPTDKQAQFHQVNLAVGGRAIDALTISIGGNDVRFAKIVDECGSDRNCADPKGTTAANLIADLVDLRNLYNELIVAVQGDAAGNGKALTAPVQKVFVTEYPDPTIDADGTRCNNEGGWFLDRMTSSEALWAKTNVIDKVNAEIRAMVARANNAGKSTRWYSVPAPSFYGRGFCSPSRWINNFHDSQNLQHDHTGTVHPNAAGWSVLGEQLRGRLAYLNTVPYSM
jgi:lysophospholipase L1-like esterase